MRTIAGGVKNMDLQSPIDIDALTVACFGSRDVRHQDIWDGARLWPDAQAALIRFFFVESFIAIEVLQTNSRIRDIFEYANQVSPLPTVIAALNNLEFFPIKNPDLLGLLLAVLVALISRVVQLHNLVSNVMGIRQNFDVRHVLYPLAKGSGAQFGPQRAKPFSDNRHELMREVFYKYTSSTSANPLVDKHDIHQALDNWSFYWITIEGIFLLIICLIVSVSVRDGRLITIFAIFIVLYVGSSRFFINRTENRIKPQIRAILANDEAKRAVQAALDAV